MIYGVIRYLTTNPLFNSHKFDVWNIVFGFIQTFPVKVSNPIKCSNKKSAECNLQFINTIPLQPDSVQLFYTANWIILCQIRMGNHSISGRASFVLFRYSIVWIWNIVHVQYWLIVQASFPTKTYKLCLFSCLLYSVTLYTLILLGTYLPHLTISCGALLA